MNIDYWTGERWVDVNYFVQTIIQEHRKKNTKEFVRIRKERARLQTDWSIPCTLCALCLDNRKGRLELHHLRPLWVYALELLLTSEGLLLVPGISRSIEVKLSMEEFVRLRKKVQIPSEATSFENLVLLCKRCHEHQERDAYEKHSSMFMTHHPLRFGGWRDRKYSSLVPQDAY